MSFYKAAGAVLLLFGGVSLGRALCQKIEAGFAQTEGFIALLKYIRNQIDCYLMPVDKILAGCDPGILETCGVSADADLSVIHSFSELLDCCELCISEVLAELLRKFAGELGTSYRDTQLKMRLLHRKAYRRARPVAGRASCAPEDDNDYMHLYFCRRCRYYDIV